MATVKIVLQNHSEKDQRFWIFSEKPELPQEVGKVWSNAWAHSPGVGSQHGTAEFEIKEHYFAVCGMEPQQLAEDLVVNTSDYEEATLASGSTPGSVQTVTIKEGGAVFEDGKPGTVNKNGSFEIDTASYDFGKYKTAFCGLGMVNPNPDQSKVLPVAVWQAEPNQKYQITPHRKYYLATGSYKAGQLVDITQIGNSISVIDFTAKDQDVATVIYNKQLAFDPPSYSYSSDN